MWHVPRLRDIKIYRGWHTPFERKSNVYCERRDRLFKEQGCIFFLLKKTSLRLKSKTLYQGFFRFDMEIPTFRNYVFDLDSFTARLLYIMLLLPH